ncbi:MAG: helix-turn-helix domain-containing protein [Treponema sp.]|jgi:AraC family transcriptional regulator of adaptative response / methylphosphotriester-DNA alkyltransferase methyltransferase|nr:helix-turn-helix domain-containing protein [Treponema sp.]
MLLTDDEMWKAAADCDGRYDGKFFYAVKTVGVYCRPSCKSKTPLRKNTRYFETPGEAEKAGFRPCKRCRPDLPDYAPVTEMIRHARELIDRHYRQRDRLAEEMKHIGVTARHLAVIFRQRYGITPLQYSNQLRADYAKKMIAETARPIIDIAGDSGFDSLAAFYRFFKKYTAATPGEYRANAAALFEAESNTLQ